MIGGAGFMFSCRIIFWLEVDDAIHTSQTHMIPAILSLFIVCLFDQNYGLFYVTDWNLNSKSFTNW